jgi:hypothetical protein
VEEGKLVVAPAASLRPSAEWWPAARFVCGATDVGPFRGLVGLGVVGWAICAPPTRGFILRQTGEPESITA